jgi:hypothetical protein
VIVVRGLDVRPQPAQVDGHLSGSECRIVAPPDREVGIASAGAGAVGARLRSCVEDEGGDQRADQSVHLRES